MMQQAELLRKIDTLPPEYFGEVFDFVAYLQQKARQKTVPADKREEPLSKQFAGALHLSDTAYEAFQNSIQESRDEWDRNIF